MRCYVAIEMSYGDIACPYDDVVSAGTNCDAAATAQRGWK